MAVGSELAVGSLLAGFRIDAALGRGGMGVVYRATQLSLERSVALKVVAPELAGEERFRERFLREAKLAASLEHPHLLPVYEAGEIDGVVFLAMKLVEGISLADLLAHDGRLEENRTVALVTQLAGALELAHAAGLVHRDVKPANVLVTHVGSLEHAYLCDFGLSRRVAGGSALTRPEGFVGSAAYAAPEQIRGAAVDGRADVYALGCLLFECLTGRRPFLHEDELALMWAHMHETPSSPSELDPSLAHFDEVLARALAKDAEGRPSALEFVRAASGLDGSTAPVRPSPSPLDNLANPPKPATPFLGRGRELTDVVELLEGAATGVVTLTGPGGTGKTRLGLQASAEARGGFPDGIAWVPLAQLRDPELVLSAVAQAVDLREEPGTDLLDALRAKLDAKKVLVLLDNAEHLLPGLAQQVAALRDAAPSVSFLVTSRERLQLAGEQVYTVPSLAESDGVALFLARARELDPDFPASGSVEKLCARLEHLPLALELAAARTVVLSPDQLLERLGERLDLLKAGRDADPRQRTLRATIDWSYDLLDEREKEVLRGLSVFADGCLLEAAEQVAGADVDTLHSLIDKSLVRRRDDDGWSRYWMLETIREHAAERLVGSGELPAVEERHTAWCLRFVCKFDGSVYSAVTATDLVRFRLERANLRVATRRAIDGGDVDTALRLVAALGPIWYHAGAVESLRDATDALRLAGGDDALRAEATLAATLFTLEWDDRGGAQTGLLEEAERLFTRLDDVRGLAGVELARCFVFDLQGDSAQAREHVQRAASHATSSGDPALIELARTNLAAVLSNSTERADLQHAKALLEEFLESSELDPFARHVTEGNLAQTLFGLGDLRGSVRHATEALRLAEQARVPFFWVVSVLLRSLFGLERHLDGAVMTGFWNRRLEAESHAASDIERLELVAHEGAARATLGDSAYERAVSEGERMTVTEVVRRLLEVAELESQPHGTKPSFVAASARAQLPTPVTAFLGREREVAEVVDLLLAEEVRLVTLTGPGGIGKTRLALQAAAAASNSFVDGVFWVPLAALRDPALVIPSLAQALEMREVPGRELEDVLVERMAGKHMLVLLDNAEHLLPDLAGTVALLPTAAGPTFLVTSRERLQVAAEHVYPVPELDGPQAVELFLARAAAAGASLEPSPVVHELCVRLEQLPLALELAASRTPLFDPEQLLERLSRRLDLLKGGRDTDPRHQTLRATIEWSYDLLSEEEQQLVRCLSVFAGGCTYEAAEQVAGAVPDTLQSLLDKSLLRSRDTARRPRYSMLETIREYGAECLEQDKAGPDVRARHARWFQQLVKEAEPLLVGSEQRHWLDRLSAEHDNLRAALSYLASDRVAQLSMATSLWRYWQTRNHLVEGRFWLTAPDDVERVAGPEITTRLHVASSRLAWKQGDLTAGLASAEAAFEVAVRANDATLLALAGENLGVVASFLGEPARALALLVESVARSRGIGDEVGLASTLNNLSGTQLELAQFDDAASSVEESIRLHRTAGNESGLAVALHTLGEVALFQGSFEEARGALEEALLLCRDLEDAAGVGMALEGLGLVAEAVNEPRKAAVLWAAGGAFRARGGFEVEPIERVLRDAAQPRVEAELGSEAFAAASQDGHALSLDSAIRVALDIELPA